MSDTVLKDAIGQTSDAESRILEEYKATDVTINTAESSVRLEFRGFSTVEDALTRTSEVCRDVSDLGDVHAGINSDGGYDPDLEEQDDRPMGWVNVIGIDTGE